MRDFFARTHLLKWVLIQHRPDYFKLKDRIGKRESDVWDMIDMFRTIAVSVLELVAL